MKQGTIFTNAALAAVLATSMATAPAMGGLTLTQGKASAGVAYAAQATPIESVANTGDWTATDAENQAILDKAKAAELVGLKPLKAYLSGETVAAADFLTIDADALATIDADLAKLVKQTQKAIADSNAASEPEAKPEAKSDPVTPAKPSETPAESTATSTPSAGTGNGSSTDKPAEDVEDAPEGMVQESELLADDIVYVARNLTTQQFIDTIGEDARKLCQQSDLYASVMIAQAVVESASGSSGLSCEPYNNLFGIKGSYDGKSVRMKTQEDDGEGHLETIVAEFRKYPTMLESLEDYVGLLTNNSLYNPVKKSNTESYEDACDYLQGRYATSTSYSRTLKAYIDAYDLTEYDKPVEEAKKDVTLDKVLTPAAMHTASTPTLNDFRVSVPEPGLPARQANPIVSGLLAALAAAAAGALGFWMYWRRKVVRESAAAHAGAHAAPEAETARPLDAAWLAEVTGLADETPAHAKAPAHAAKPAHAATPADSESPTKPLSLE